MRLRARLARGSVVAIAVVSAIGSPALAGRVFVIGVSAAPASVSPDGDYIVVLRDTADPRAALAKHHKKLGVEPTFVFEHALKGYAARLGELSKRAIESDPAVLFVARDGVMSAAAKPGPPSPNRRRTPATASYGSTAT